MRNVLKSYGWTGKVLCVDLTNRKITKVPTADYEPEKFIGGVGLNAKIFWELGCPKVSAFDPDNPFIISVGPLTGLSGPFTRAQICSISPQSYPKELFSYSGIGGKWPSELKYAGYDGMVILGKADKPVYLSVYDEDVKIKDAGSLWGADTFDAQKALMADDPATSVLAIGPAGENLSRIAVILNESGNAAGQGGFGGVMGSKNLKAIAVKGSGTISVTKPKGLRRLAQWMARKIDDLAHGMHTYGTGAVMGVYEETGNLPIHNFRDGDFSNVDSISAQAVKENVRIGMGTCFACAVACKKEVKIEGRWNVDPAYGGPEYETLAALGSNCGVDDLEAVCKANELCQRYSLDTISTGVAIGFAMECFEEGLLTKEITGGLDLRFGNAESMVKLVELIGKREGIGDLLAEGTRRAAERISNGAEKLAVHVKGQEVPMHEPRLKKGLGLGYAVSPTGADHVHNIHDTVLAPEMPTRYKSLGILESVPVDDLGPTKIRLFKYVMMWRSLNNCLVMCLFPPWSVQQKVDIVRYVTGWNTTAFELMKVSERAINLARVFNIREGFTEADDWLPPRFFHPKTSGALSKTAVDPAKLRDAKTTYYSMMGWNEEGVPRRTTLDELDIAWAANEIGRR